MQSSSSQMFVEVLDATLILEVQFAVACHYMQFLNFLNNFQVFLEQYSTLFTC